jgi:hypothetical protein
MMRKLIVGISAGAVAFAGIVMFANPASAGKPIVGNATGSASCTAGGKVKINPGLKNEDNATNNYAGYAGVPRWVVGPSLTTAKLKLACTGTTGIPGVSPLKGKVTATSQGTAPGTCSGLLDTTPGTDPFVIDIKWKANGGKGMNDTHIAYSGFQTEGLGFKLPGDGGTATVSGSYAGNTSEAHAVLAAVPDLSRCEPKIKCKEDKTGATCTASSEKLKVKAGKGMKKLDLAESGTLTITP